MRKMIKLFLAMFIVLVACLRDQHGADIVVTGITEIDAAIPEFWADGIIKDGTRESFWGSLAGKEGSRMPIIDKTGPLKSKGDKLTFNTIAQLMGAGVTGETALKGKEEKMLIGTFTVGCDIVRHATGVSKKATFQENFDTVKSAGELLKDWASRKMDADMFNTILAITGETIYANSEASEAALYTASHYFGVTEIEMIRMALIRKGALPLKVYKQNGRSVPVYGCVFGEIEDYRLSQNTTFVNACKDALERFKQGMGEHPLFQGALGMYRNMILYPYYSILPIPQGTPLRPETIVYATLTTTATTLTVASTASYDYTAFFASSGSLQIGDEVISYSGKTANTFTGLTRGASSTTATQAVPNALITQRNISTVIGFGAEMACRAIGEQPTPVGEKDDYGASIGLGIEAYYGQAVKKDARLGRYPNVVLCKVYSKNPGTI